MIFRLAQTAIEDLESIDDYNARTWKAEQADLYLAMFWATFEQIGANPGR
jgi:plasmid stabilization system protein ParE